MIISLTFDRYAEETSYRSSHHEFCYMGNNKNAYPPNTITNLQTSMHLTCTIQANYIHIEFNTRIKPAQKIKLNPLRLSQNNREASSMHTNSQGKIFMSGNNKIAPTIRK